MDDTSPEQGPAAREVMFVADLPACCATTSLRLPRPDLATFRITGGSDLTEGWDLGLDTWYLDVDVQWDQDLAALEDAVATHLGRPAGTWSETRQVIADHGVSVDNEASARAGSASLVVANLMSDLNKAAGRRYLSTPHSLWYAADALSNDLNELVAPLIDFDGDEGNWTEYVLDNWPEAEMADTAVLLRSVRITPILRGHLLGAWTAAQGIAMFDHGRSLVATMASPLGRQDGVPGFNDDHQDFTPAEEAQWQAEKQRLTNHRATRLGLSPLPEQPNVLVWHSAYKNPDLDATLSAWA